MCNDKPCERFCVEWSGIWITVLRFKDVEEDDTLAEVGRKEKKRKGTRVLEQEREKYRSTLY